jgi:hypothetical protein
MTGVISTANHAKLLWPGLKELWGMSYDELSQQWSKVLEKGTSDKSYEELQEITGFGLAVVKPEGTAVSYDSHSQGVTTTLRAVTYGLGFIVTEEEGDDNKYKQVGTFRARALGFSMRQSKEIVAANLINRGFTAAYAGGDGKELFSTAHPVVAGTQSNYLSPAADLSEAALESMLIQISNARNSRGMRIGLKGKKLVVPPELQFDANRIVNSNLRPGTANNDINAMKDMGMLPDGVFVWQYMDQGDDFFIKTDLPTGGGMLLQRKEASIKKDNDFDTANDKNKSTERYVVGYGDWRWAYGSIGV